MSRILRPLFVVLLIAGGLAACGKRGHLDPPPSETRTSRDGQAGEAATTRNSAGRIKRVPITAPKRELLIDRILD